MERFFATDALEHEILMAESRLLNPSLENRDTIASIHAFIDRARKTQEYLPQKQFGIRNISSFELGGEGTFGIVWKCKINGLPVALKQQKISSNVSVSENFRERDILIELQHPHIIKLLGALYDGNVFFLFEKCEGDTAVYLQNIKHQHLEGMINQLLSAVVFMHSKQIIHRDIKPANILLTNESSIKLADFGTACKLPEGQDTKTDEYEIGTFCYAPVEVLKSGEFSKKSDLFSVGATIYEWDTKFPLLGSRVERDGNAKFYYDAQKLGRILEKKEGQHYEYMTEKNHEFRREKISERIHKSRFGLFLEVICNQAVHLRPASDKVMNLTILQTAFNKLREKTKNEIPTGVVSDGGAAQKSFSERRNAPPFNKARLSDNKMQEMIGFYFEDPDFFASSNQKIECFEKTITMVNRSGPGINFGTVDKSVPRRSFVMVNKSVPRRSVVMVDKSVPRRSCNMVDKEVHKMSFDMIQVECQTSNLVEIASPVFVSAGPNAGHEIVTSKMSNPNETPISKSPISTTHLVINSSADSKIEFEDNEMRNQHFASKSAETSTSVKEKETIERKNMDSLSRSRHVNKGNKKQQRSRKNDSKPKRKVPVASSSGLEKSFMKESHKKKPRKLRRVVSSDSEHTTKQNKHSGKKASKETELSSSSEDEEYKFECPVCRKKFKRAGNLSRHEKLHQKEFRCKECRIEFDNEKALSSHIDTHGKKLKIKKCPWCHEGMGQGFASYTFHLKICKKYNGGGHLRGLYRKDKEKEEQ